jgi:hypothetical protein
MGWEIWIEKKEEAGQSVWYEHLAKCPHLEKQWGHVLKLE